MRDRRLTNHQKGLLGEAAAEGVLVDQGMSCIDRRYHSPYGEIDLVMLKDDILVFAEVKARTNRSLLSAQQAVTPAKQRRLIQTALCFLAEHPEYANHLIRFDVVTLSDDCIDHIPDAFQGYGW